MQAELLKEAQRQAEICNACRYCESYCAVFPEIHSLRAFTDGNLTQFANLCHNCRACYYACQYSAPHEFDVNLPKALAEVRQDSWEHFAWPGGLARVFQQSGGMIALASVLGSALFIWLAQVLPNAGGEGFYAVLSHNVMITIFIPAFLFPCLSLTISLRRYWQHVGGKPLTQKHWAHAFSSAATMKNLAGGHSQGCNFEDEDRFSQARRHTHQALLWGFLLCFASTSVATLMHYALAWPAPYPWWTPPKLLGLPGGVLMTAGAIGLAFLKTKADRSLGAANAWSGEMAFVLLLGFVAISGLALYLLGQTQALQLVLALHLGSVLTLFTLTPFTKMAHGFYRMAALLRAAQSS